MRPTRLAAPLDQISQLSLDVVGCFRFAGQIQPRGLARLDPPGRISVGEAVCFDRPQEHVRPDFQLIAAAGVDLPGLKRSEQPRLGQGVDPDRIEESEFACQPADLRLVAEHFAGGGQPQSFHQCDELS